MNGIFLVGGSPSSGSTLLVDLLNLREGILGLPETGLFSHGGNLTDLSAPARDDDLGWTVPWISTKAKVAGALGWRSSRYDAAIASHGNAFDLLRTEIDPGFSEWLIEKTPENIFAFRRYLEASSEHRVVVTSRDALSVTQSLMRRGFTMMESLLAWFSHAYETVRLLRDFPAQIHHCSYGTVTSDPEGAIETILDFWSISRPPRHYRGGVKSIAADEVLRLRFLADMASQRLASSAWRAAPGQHVQVTKPTNLIGVRFEVMMDTVVFKTSHDGMVTPRTIDSSIACSQMQREINTCDAPVEPMVMSWRYSYFDYLAANYRPHLLTC